MIELSLGLIISAFIAGLLMFLAPCTLPLVPAYLAFISGVKADEITDTEAGAAAKKKIFHNAVAFVIGFSAVFIVFGMLAGFFGSFIGQFRGLLTQVGGVFIIIFGLMMLNVIKIAPLLKERRIKMPAALTPGKSSSAAVMGSVFALGWTPCVGPVLASVLLLATTSSTVWQGGFLLAVFSLGLAIPFILVALLYANASKTIAKYSYISSGISIIGGLFLIAIGFLLLTDNFVVVVEYGYRFFNFFKLDGLFNYL